MKIASRFASNGKTFFDASDHDLPASGIKIVDRLEEGDFGWAQIKAFIQDNLMLHYTFNRFAAPTDFVISTDTDLLVNTLILNSETGAWRSDYEPYLVSPDEVFASQFLLQGELEFCAPEKIELFRIFATPVFYMEILGNYGDTFREIMQRIKDKAAGNLFVNPLPVSPRMKMIIKEILNYKNANEILTRNFVKNKMQEIIHLQLEFLLAQSESQNLQKLNIIDQQKIHEAQKILKFNFHQPPTLKQLAAMLATNEFKLKTGFNQMYHTSVYQYVIGLRIEKAIELMYNKNYSLDQISEMVGYANLSHFTRVFKKIKGIAPGAFRAGLA
jgi:AraC-like DNA-binding protein